MSGTFGDFTNEKKPEVVLDPSNPFSCIPADQPWDQTANFSNAFS